MRSWVARIVFLLKPRCLVTEMTKFAPITVESWIGPRITELHECTGQSVISTFSRERRWGRYDSSSAASACRGRSLGKGTGLSSARSREHHEVADLEWGCLELE